MTASGFTLRRTALVALQQIGLGAVLFVLLAGWLQIPDANAFEIAVSVLLALLMIVVAGAGESAIALRLLKRQLSAQRLLIGAGIIFAAAVLWYVFALGVDHLAAGDGLRAGYLNSKSPAGLRNIFSYEHIILWFGWFWVLLRWIVAGLLTAAVFTLVVCQKPLPCFRSVLRSAWYWVAVFLLALVAAVVTGALLQWTPGHGISIELFSVLLRLIAVIVVNAAAIALLLQAMAHAVLQAQLDGTADPAISQPRTAGIP